MLEQVEAGQLVQDLKMHVLQAIQYIIKAWEEISVETISNSWHHTKILNNDALLVTTDDQVLNELAETLDALGLPNAMEIEEFLTLPDENIVYQLPENDQIIVDLANTFRRREGETKNSDEDDDSTEILIISTSTALRNLESVKLFLLQQEGVADQIRSVNTLEKFIGGLKINKAQQSYINAYYDAL